MAARPEKLAALGYTEAWMRAGIVDDARLDAQFEQWQRAGGSRSKGLRAGDGGDGRGWGDERAAQTGRPANARIRLVPFASLLCSDAGAVEASIDPHCDGPQATGTSPHPSPSPHPPPVAL